jgi:hypothetical protein
MFTAGVAAQGGKHDIEISLRYLEQRLVDSVYESTRISFIESACAGAKASKMPIS